MKDELRNLKNLIEEKLGEIVGEIQEENAEYVGELSIELHKKIRSLAKRKEHLFEDIELRKCELGLELERKLQSEFDEKLDAFKDSHMEVWNEIYRAMLINPKDSYYHDNGSLYREKTRNEKRPFAISVERIRNSDRR